MTALTVTAYSGAEDLLGKSVEDLQTGVTVSGTTASGTLKYVDDYTGFSGDVSEQSGHYLVLHAAVDDGVTVTAEVVGGDHGPVTLDDDGILIARIKNVAQRVKFTASKEGEEPNTITITLAGMILEPEG